MAFEFETAALTADVTLFCVRGGALQILLIERGHAPFQGSWALPGGFVDPGENPEAAAGRELMEETGVTAPWLHHVGGFGDVGRDPRGRTVTLTYLTVAHDAQPVAGDDAARAQWWPITALPPLAFDHGQMVAMALERLAALVMDPRRLPDLLGETVTAEAFVAALSAALQSPIPPAQLL